MRIHYVGLGKMGLNMVARMVQKRHRVTAFDLDAKARRKAEAIGADTVSAIQDLLAHAEGRRVVWIMVPYSVVEVVLEDLLPQLQPGDIVIEAGNSPYMMSVQRAAALKKNGIDYLDIGVSGGPEGAKFGACMMVGGSKSAYKIVEGLIADLCVKDGYEHVGASGAGHYVKMIHNGIEYGMMQAIAEGFEIMHQTQEFKLNLKQIAGLYARGSVIESRLIDWMAEGYEKFGQNLSKVSGTAIGTGEGGWTIATARELGVPVKVIHEAFLARKRSEKQPNYQGKVIMALRNAFGGHSPK